MKLSYEDHDTITVLRISGELTADQIDAFRRSCLDRLAAGVRHIVLDLEHLTLIDSAGLESLLWLSEEVSHPLSLAGTSGYAYTGATPAGGGMTAGGGQLRLVNPDETVRKILYITRLDRRFAIHDSVESAAKSLR